MDAGGGSEFSGLGRCVLDGIDAGKSCERCAVKDQVTDGILDAAVDAAADLGVARANPGVPRSAFLNLAAGKPGVGVQAKSLLNFFEAKIADSDLAERGSDGDECNGGNQRHAAYTRIKLLTEDVLCRTHLQWHCWYFDS